MKVLHLPTDVGGNSWALACGERKLGIESVVLVKQGSWLEYPNDINLLWDMKSSAGKLIDAVKTFIKTRNRFDIFHFNFGTSLIDTASLPLFDLPFFPRDRVFFTYNGCDARQKSGTVARVNFSACHDSQCYGGMCNDGSLDSLRERKIKKAASRSSVIFALNPDLLWFLPESAVFLPYAVGIGLPRERFKPGKKIRIVHAPTNRAAKGSAYILKALDELKKKYEIEVILVENKPHKEALEVYRQADIVIDQVLVGWYGGLAVEVMKMGKPVAAFIREEDLRFIPGKMAADLKEAIININPSNIASALGEYLENPRLLNDKHNAALEYAHKWHDPVFVAGITKSFYEGNRIKT